MAIDIKEYLTPPILLIIFLLVISSKLPSNTDVQPIEGASETLNIDISSVNLIGEHSFKSREPSEELKITIINWYRKSALSPDNFVKYLESNNPKILDDISKENIYNLIIMQ